MAATAATGATAFLVHLRDHINSLDGDYIASEQAEAFLSYMEQEHPSELDAWVNAHILEFITIKLGQVRRSRRSSALRSARARAFGAAIESGSIQSLLDQTFAIDLDATLRPLRNMTAADCRFAANEFEKQARTETLWAEVLRRLAKRIGPNKTVGETLSADQVDRIATRIFGAPPPPPTDA
jgi:hypothetical protein